MSFLGGVKRSKSAIVRTPRVTVIAPEDRALNDALEAEAGKKVTAETPDRRKLYLYREQVERKGRVDDEYVMVDSASGDYQVVDASSADIDRIARMWARFVKSKSVNWNAMF